jgi:hypothetical protein
MGWGSTSCGCCSYPVSSISVRRVTCYDHFCVNCMFFLLCDFFFFCIHNICLYTKVLSLVWIYFSYFYSCFEHVDRYAHNLHGLRCSSSLNTSISVGNYYINNIMNNILEVFETSGKEVFTSKNKRNILLTIVVCFICYLFILFSALYHLKPIWFIFV